MRKEEDRNWTKIKKSLLRFGDLSRYQRDVQKINIEYTQAWIKCENCDKDLKVRKSGKDWSLKDDNNREWEAFRRKATVKKDETGYYFTTRVEFYCPDCWEKK